MFCQCAEPNQRWYRTQLFALLEWQERDLVSVAHDNGRGILVFEGNAGTYFGTGGCGTIQFPLMQAHNPNVVRDDRHPDKRRAYNVRTPYRAHDKVCHNLQQGLSTSAAGQSVEGAGQDYSWADRSWRYQGVPFEPVDLQRAGWQWWRNIGRIRHRRHRSGFNTLEGPLGWQAVGASRRPRWVYVCGPQIDWNNSCAAGRRDGQVSLRTTKDSEHEASGTILYWCCDCPLLHPVQRRCQAPQRPGMSASEKPAAPMWSLGKGDMKGVQKSSNNNCLINQLYKNMESL